MQTKAWTMKGGFLLGGILVLAGLMLQWSVGSVPWKALAWPVNGFVLAIFLALIISIRLFRKKIGVFSFLSTREAAIPALVYVIVLTIVMGLTRQTNDGTGLNDMLTFWPFVLTYFYMTLILGLVVLKHAKRSVKSFSVLFHLGLFIVLTAGTLGSADMQRLKMMTAIGQPEWRALAQNGEVRELPIAVELKKFIMESHDNGSPKRFASEVLLQTRSGKSIRATIDVNKPFGVDGWKIYQYGYDTQKGPQSQISILEFVRDPWLPVVYVGIYMMLAGACFLFLTSLPIKKAVTVVRRYPKRALTFGVLVAIVFLCIHHFMPVLHSKTLVPALQSPWFVPHIVAYMTAYTLMGVAAVMAVYRLVKRTEIGIEDTLVGIGIAFITVGMLFGALWAKEAWGHYWSWDPRETWAAVTWFAYLGYIHYRRLPNHNRQIALFALLVAFALLQMCWWGIKFLPSAQGVSAHTYAV